jgi:FAD-linked oxidoreductase
MQRRRFLKGSVLLGAGAAIGSTAGCGPHGEEPQSPVNYEPGKPLPWINWAGNQHCYPESRKAPQNTDQLVDIMKSAKGVIRAVGSGHSFSGLVPTDDTLISTDLMSGLVSHDPKSLQATLLGGTTLRDCGPILDAIGQAMPNMPDMDYPTLAGAIASSVHATGAAFGSMSSYVVALKLVTPQGELIECSADKNPEIFQAARTSLGALGVISEITIQNQTPFNLTEVNGVTTANEIWATLDQRVANNRHFELFTIPYSDLILTVTTNLAKPEDNNSGEDDPQAVNALREAFNATHWIPAIGSRLYSKLLDLSMSGSANVIRTGKSYEVFPHVRIVRFREMEYTVPAEVGPACMQEIMQTIRTKKLPISFPFEYRYVKGDDVWLSMFEGRDGCSISIHQYGDLDYKRVFAEIEPIFWKYEGRPHWGKIHTLDAQRLASLYPRHWQDFQEIRTALDPEGKMMNKHLKQIFGDR